MVERLSFLLLKGVEEDCGGCLKYSVRCHLQPGYEAVLLLRSDLKGANVLIKNVKATEKDPRGYICKLADFGLARVLGSNRTHVSTSTHGEHTQHLLHSLPG